MPQAHYLVCPYVVQIRDLAVLSSLAEMIPLAEFVTLLLGFAAAAVPLAASRLRACSEFASAVDNIQLERRTISTIAS